MLSQSDTADHDLRLPSIGEALGTWLRVAALSFGGPTSQIAVMHRIIVDEKRWISEERFLHALNYCMLLPGPEAQQLATYIGWLLHGVRGGVLAGTLFVVPGFFSILGLSLLYVYGQDTALVVGLFFGLKPAVVAVIAEAVQRIGKRVLRNRLMILIAVVAFIAIFHFHVPFPIVIACAATLGLIGHRFAPDLFRSRATHASQQKTSSAAGARSLDDLISTRHVSVRQSLVLTLICLVLWWLPIVGLAMSLGRDHTIVTEGIFFSKVAVVTFGGAYSVLSYVQQQAVDHYGWVSAEEMVDGLGMAETTPGPLIQVVQFVAFLGAYRAAFDGPDSLLPWQAGVLASIVTTWVTYLPCFLWIFLGAPYIERLRGNQPLNAALTTVTAAVVGVIFNLAITFALHVFFRDVQSREWFGLHWLQPRMGSFELQSFVIAAIAVVLIFVVKRGILTTLVICAALGAAWQFFRANSGS